MSKIRQFFGLGPSKREQRRMEQEALEQRAGNRRRIEKQMFLKLLRTMCETYEHQKLNSWYHDFGGWNPGPTVRAYKIAPTAPIFEIHHETRRGSPNYYNIQVCRNVPEFEEIYKERYFVPDHRRRYVDAVFELVRFGPDAITSETRQTLKDLKKITDRHPVIWTNYKESRAICYMQGLQKHR